MAEKDPDSPATTSEAYDRMLPRWTLIESLLGGTETMRLAGETYLPKHQEETDLGYESRKNATTLLNMTKKTLGSLVSKPFSEPLKPNEDIPESIISEILGDVDLQGNNLDVFCRRWFQSGMSKAFSHVLVDMPRQEPSLDGKPRTLADDRKQGTRPYWVHIEPECLLSARAEIINGEEVLQHIRIMETYTEQVGFAEVEKSQIRVVEPGLVQIYRINESNKQKEEWLLYDEWNTGIDFVPLVTFYADRTGFMEGQPPLMDLAWLNVTHWQSSSDQRNILKVSRFPILACSGSSGEDDDSPVVVGPNKVLYNEDPQGKFYYVEHTGAAIQAGSEDLKSLEDQMAAYGAEFLRKKPGNQTATARALDSSEANSELSSIVVSFEDALATVLGITAVWMGLGEDGGTVEAVKDYSSAEADKIGLDVLIKLRDKRDISRKALIQALKLRDILPEDFDEEADYEEILDEASAELGQALLELDPQQEDQDDDEDDEEQETKE